MTKAIAHLRSGDTVDITLPLERHEEYPGWRVDQHGVLLNMQHVSAITFAPAEVPDHRVGQKLVALIDREDDQWVKRDDGFHLIAKSSGIPLAEPWQRGQVEEAYGPVSEVWE